MNPGVYKDILDQLYDGIYMVDRSGTITYWNKAAERITGYSAEEAIGKRCSDNLLRHVTADGTELCVHGCPLTDTLSDGQPREAAVFLHHKSGHRMPITVRISPLRNELGIVEGAVEVFTDNSSRTSPAHELEELRVKSLLDELTGVGNRRAAEGALRSVHDTYLMDSVPYSLLFVDVDRFKRVNDAFGHAVGDKVLRMVATTLKKGLRDRDAVFRWGGEEFLIVLKGSGYNSAKAAAERMRALVERCWIEENDHQVAVTISVGGAVVCNDCWPEDVIKRADAELYHCKANGRNCSSIANAALSRRLQQAPTGPTPPQE